MNTRITVEVKSDDGYGTPIVTAPFNKLEDALKYAKSKGHYGKVARVWEGSKNIAIVRRGKISEGV